MNTYPVKTFQNASTNPYKINSSTFNEFSAGIPIQVNVLYLH